MKKTLITLAALAAASVAQAATLADAAKDIPSPSVDYMNTGVSGAAYTMMVVLDWDTITTQLSGYNSRKDIEFGYNGGDGTLWMANSIRLFAETDTSTGKNNIFASIAIDARSGDPLKGTNYGVGANDYNLVLDAANFKDASGNLALTLTFDGTKNYALYALKNDGTETLAYRTATKDTEWNYNTIKFDYMDINTPEGVVERVITFDGVLSSADIASISSQVIPEPTTATLSLLALAGLAARRRRK